MQRTLDVFARFPEAPIEIERRDTSIRVAPTVEGTFPIMVYDEGDQTMIAADRWHTHYDDPDQVAFCALWLMTPFYRLVQELKGGVLVATWIERYETTGWEGFEPVYFLNPEHEESWELQPGEVFQRRYHQQSVLPPPAPYERFQPGIELDDRALPPGWRQGSWTVEADHAIGPSLV